MSTSKDAVGLLDTTADLPSGNNNIISMFYGIEIVQHVLVTCGALPRSKKQERVIKCEHHLAASQISMRGWSSFNRCYSRLKILDAQKHIGRGDAHP